jgi:hypothetical protein
MGAFNINITGVGGHGCERKAKPGEKLHGRCGRFTCPDCLAYEFTQRLRQAGMVRDGDQAYSVEVTNIDGATVEADGSLTLADGQKAFKVDGKWWRAVPQKAEFTHWPEEPGTVVDDMLKNERRSGSF